MTHFTSASPALVQLDENFMIIGQEIALPQLSIF